MYNYSAVFSFLIVFTQVNLCLPSHYLVV
jgi:hypothetical protein